MPELRNIRPRDANSALEKAGGLVRRGKGDHVNVKMPNGQILTFSGEKEPLKIGLLKALLRKADLSEEVFLRLLGRI
ncbi:MAG TPA: type II toxin-antitoxin system HicA family toxin [Chloroflexota bacterium]|nr:type II toxin-antitoxin system HicA family toxin [Chloroflexota bacterium]